MAEGWDEDGLRAVRGALQGADGMALLAALRRGPVSEVLQLAGDGVAGTAALGLPGAPQMAATFLGALRERGFRGDEELADVLRRSVGHVVNPALCPLSVDLEMLAMLLEGDPVESGGRLDLSTGECRPAIADELDTGFEEADDPDRWLSVPALGSRDGYEDMELFIEMLGDTALADRLRTTIHGRGAFRRFKDVLARDERAWRRFHRLSDERRLGRARAWLAEEGCRPRLPFGGDR
ncbi:hypothetical protein [Streptomyces sp. NPDC057740]|uniref:hypothetical protein n=1 Tax=Streptomyces sp. NPDC057740 TaxID=3346234 RepID=UPI00369D6600